MSDNYFSVQLRPMAALGEARSLSDLSTQVFFDSKDLESIRHAWGEALGIAMGRPVAVFNKPLIDGPWRKAPRVGETRAGIIGMAVWS